MGIGKNWATDEIEFDLLKWETIMLSKRTKTRVSGSCWGCGGHIPTGSLAYGDSYTRVCVKCWENKVVPSVKMGVAIILNMISASEIDLEKNRKKIDQVNMLANLQ